MTGESAAGGRRKAPRTCAVAGSRRGAGTTHLAVSAAFAAARSRPGAGVACFLSDKRELDCLLSLPGADRAAGTLHGVRFDYLREKLRWSEVEEGFVVVDCGVLSPGSDSRPMQLFWQADLQAFVLGGGPWDARPLLELLGRVRPADFKEWTWCFFGASVELIGLVGSFFKDNGVRMGRRFMVPYDNAYLSAWRGSEEAYVQYRDYLLGDKGARGRRRGKEPAKGGGEGDEEERA